MRLAAAWRKCWRALLVSPGFGIVGIVFITSSSIPLFGQAQEQVRFVVNDAFVKDQLISGVGITVVDEAGEEIAKGVTDDQGEWQVVLPPRTYNIRFSKASYIPLATDIEITRSNQIVTTTLSRLLEAEGQSDRQRIRILLNWGSDEDTHVKDVDSHLECSCGGSDPHVYFGTMEHQHDQHSVSLDVDDIDWGGPETITLLDAPPGEYIYWVHNYSGPPETLGNSQLTVRVLHGNNIISDLRVPIDIKDRIWRPFSAIEVDHFGSVAIRPFTAEELTLGLDRQPPPGHESQGEMDDSLARSIGCGFAFLMLLMITIGARILRR